MARSKDRVFLKGYMKVIILFLFLVGCASHPDGRMYNHDEEQDLDCYAKFGGQWGFCDATRGNK